MHHMENAEALVDSPLIGALMIDLRHVFDKEVMPLLNPVTLALFGRTSRACRDAVLEEHNPALQPHAGGATGALFRIEDFVSSVPLLAWARENGGPWDHTVCETASHTGHTEVANWAWSNDCPWDTQVLREWGRVCPKLLPLSKWGDWNLHSQKSVVLCIRLNSQTLRRVPAELGRLKSLVNLELGNNRLTSVPPELGQLIALQELALGSNHLTSLPPELWKLSALQKLALDNNQLTSLPPELGQLAALQELALDSNHLTSLPPELGQLAALHKLGLDNNQLTSLPPELGQLTALQELTLANNRLTSVPPELGRITFRNTFSCRLHGNYLTIVSPNFRPYFDIESQLNPDNKRHNCFSV
jgi:hypothetical protein